MQSLVTVVTKTELPVGWENNLQQMQQRPQPVLLDKRQSKPKPNATAQRVQPSASSKQRQTQQSDDDPDEFTIPYDGLHLLECHGMTQHDTVLNLEAFLQQMPTNSVAPVVRYLSSYAFCRGDHEMLCVCLLHDALLTARRATR